MSEPLPFTGMIASPPDARDLDFAASELAGGVEVTRQSIDTTGDGHIERDQFCNACVQYTLDQAVQDLDRKCVALGVPVRVARTNADGSLMIDDRNKLVVADDPIVRTETLPLTSPIFGYAGGRLMRLHAMRQPVPPDGLPDTGSSYRHGIQWRRDVENGGGTREDALFPDVPENSRRLPPAHVMQADPLVKIGGYYRIHGEGNEQALRDGIVAALLGYQRGLCSKPCTSMLVGDEFVNTPEGEIFQGRQGAKGAAHAMLVKGYDGPTDCAILHQTWQGRPRTNRVPISILATRGWGFESWVVKDLIYIPRAA